MGIFANPRGRPRGKLQFETNEEANEKARLESKIRETYLMMKELGRLGKPLKSPTPSVSLRFDDEEDYEKLREYRDKMYDEIPREFIRAMETGDVRMLEKIQEYLRFWINIRRINRSLRESSRRIGLMPMRW